MALLNRDKDASEQRETYNFNFGLTATGQTLVLGPIAFPAQIIAVSQAALGLSGSPVYSLQINRFVPGVGMTTIGLGATLTVVTHGTSGVQGWSIVQGATQLLMANDVLVLSTTVANTAVSNLAVSLVVKALQDIKTHFGV